MNIVSLIGHLNADPKITIYKADIEKGIPKERCRSISYFEIGVAKRNLTVGKGSQSKDWIPVTFFNGPQAKFIRDYLRKGDLVELTGRIEASMCTGSDGIEKKNLRVIGRDIQCLTSIRKDRQKRSLG